MTSNIQILLALMSAACLAGCDANTSQTVCENVKVKEILSLDYRDASILLTNGQTVSVNQAKLKPGDDYQYCHVVNKEH